MNLIMFVERGGGQSSGRATTSLRSLRLLTGATRLLNLPPSHASHPFVFQRVSRSVYLHEKNLPAEQTEACPDPRVSRTDGNPRWPVGVEAPASQGPRTTDGLTFTNSRHTFPRQRRLLRSADFDQVFRNGQRSADRFFTILFHLNSVDHPRLGFAISKQKVRLAVGRNRLRRLVRESFRLRADELPSLDLVVLARDAAKSASNTELFSSLASHWSRITTGAGKPTGKITT